MKKQTETAPKSRSSAPKGKLLAAVLLCVVLVAGAVVLAVLHNRKKQADEALFRQMSAEWDAAYNNEAFIQYYMVLDDPDTNQFLLITDSYTPNIFLSESPIPQNPEWYTAGLQQCLDGQKTEQAMFAAKLYTVLAEHKDFRWKTEALVLGIALFERADTLTEDQTDYCMMSFASHVTDI